VAPESSSSSARRGDCAARAPPGAESQVSTGRGGAGRGGAGSDPLPRALDHKRELELAQRLAYQPAAGRAASAPAKPAHGAGGSGGGRFPAELVIFVVPELQRLLRRLGKRAIPARHTAARAEQRRNPAGEERGLEEPWRHRGALAVLL